MGTSESIPVAPDDCELLAGSTNGGTCSAQVLCADAEEANQLDCELSDDGLHCVCDGVEFRMEGLDEQTACDQALALCTRPVTLLGSAPTECAQQTVEDVDYCSQGQHCVAVLDLGAGVVARVERQTLPDLDCFLDSEGAWTCYCRYANDGSPVAYSVVTADRTPCAALAPYCHGDQAIEMLDDPECEDHIETSDADESSSCGHQHHCVQLGLFGELAVSITTERWGSCEWGAVAHCTCDAYGAQLEFETATQDDNCEAAIDVCRRHSAIEASEPASCGTRDEVFDAETGCSIDAVCTRPSALDDQDLDVEERAHLECDVRAGAWECACTSDEEFVALGAEQGSDAEASCKELASQCAQQLLPAAREDDAPR